MNIHHYQSAREFLRDSLEAKQRKNPRYSLRSWAKQLGMSTHAPLNLMLSGKRPIPKKYVPHFIKSLELTSAEGLFLETLIEYNQTRSPLMQEMYAQRLQELSPGQTINMVELDTFKYFGDPLHIIVREMIDLQDFSEDPKWIQSRLQFKASTTAIQGVLERLQNLELVKRNAEGKLYKTHKHITNRPDVADLGSQEYHKNVSQLAQELISTIPVEEREYNGYSMNIVKKDIPKAKRLIRSFAKDFMEKIEVTHDGEETFQLNIQFFGLTTHQGKIHETV